MAGRMGARLLAIVAEGDSGRVYLAPTDEHAAMAANAQPKWIPETSLPDDPRNFWTVQYGLTTFGDLFTDRQLVALNTFSDLIAEARERIRQDAGAARHARRRPALPRRRRGSSRLRRRARRLLGVLPEQSRGSEHFAVRLGAEDGSTARYIRPAGLTDDVGLRRNQSACGCRRGHLWHRAFAVRSARPAYRRCCGIGYPGRRGATRRVCHDRLHRSALLRQHRLRRTSPTSSTSGCGVRCDRSSPTCSPR